MQFPPLTNSFTLGQTEFALFAEQPAIELSGIYKQYWSYAVGIANGGSAAFLPSDDNTFKDVYFRVAHRWYGFPLDGVIGESTTAKSAKPADNAKSDDDTDGGPQGLNFWQAWNLDTGIYGWYGKANVPLTPLTGVAYDQNDHTTFVDDHFQRIGFDGRFTYFDLDIYGTAWYGHDPFPGFDQNTIAVGSTQHFGYMVEADYMIKPWICAFVRYEQVQILSGKLADENEARVVPGVVFAIRQNVHLSTEVYIDTHGNDNPNPANPSSPSAAGLPEATTQWLTTLWWAY